MLWANPPGLSGKPISEERMTGERQTRLLYLIFLGSGIAGLVNEIVWEKYMTLFMGAGVYSQATVLGTFMFGLALGSWLVGRWGERVASPLRMYGLLELGIGLYALLFPFLIPLGEALYAQLLTNDSPLATVLLVKFVLSFLIMAPPATLMGGTLPVLSKYIIQRRLDAGRKLSLLYTLNCLGAVGGCLLAGFVLIAHLGLANSLRLAAAINIGIALLVVLLARRLAAAAAEPVCAAASEPEADAAPRHNFRSSRQVTACFVLALLSGLAAMLYEVAWIRLLSNILGTTTYSFALMLAVFILGLALGSLVASWIADRVKDLSLTIIVLELLTILSLGLTLPLYNRLPYCLHLLTTSLVHNPTTFYVFAVLQAGLCALVMLGPCLLSGMILPLLGLVSLGDLRQVSRNVGLLFACNTLGTILTALATGLVLIPWLGIMKTLYVGLGINALMMVVALLLTAERWPLRLALTLAGGAALAAIFALVPALDPYMLITSEYRHGRLGEVYTDYAGYRERIGRNLRILALNEGRTCNVVVTEEPANGNRSLWINGKADASTSVDADLVTQTLVGIIGHLMQPGKERVMVVGMGSGTTVACAALPQSVQRVDVAEISPEVVEALPYFASVNHNVANDPKVRVRVEDAKTYMRLLREPYGIIVNEPSNPWIAGIGGLFTVDYYRQVHAALDDDGVLVQWVQLYEISDEVALSILHSLSQVFPEMDLWFSGSVDLVITAYKKPHPLDPARARRAFAELAPHLTAAQLMSLEEILMRHMANPAVVREYLAAHPPVCLNTDDRPFVEYEGPHQLFLRRSANFHLDLDQRLQSPEQSRYPFYPLLAGRSDAELLAAARHFRQQTVFSTRLRKLDVMVSDRRYTPSPWYRLYSLPQLEANYAATASIEERAWFARQLCKEYGELRNAFVAIPFHEFLRRITAASLAELPGDRELRRNLDELDRYCPRPRDHAQ